MRIDVVNQNYIDSQPNFAKFQSLGSKNNEYYNEKISLKKYLNSPKNSVWNIEFAESTITIAEVPTTYTWGQNSFNKKAL